MEIIYKKGNQTTFKVDMEESLANAIRRYLNQIPILALDEVEIIQNGSALYDEVVAHRLGLIPLKMDKVVGEKGKLKLVSKKEGMVKSGELKGNVKVVFDNMPITFLDKDQEIELIATTKEGKGSKHVKFSPGLMFYRNISEITMDKAFLEEVKKICPDADISEKGNKIIIIDNKHKGILDVCEGIADKMGKEVEVKTKEGLIISIESFGQVDVKDIFMRSISGLQKDLAEISKKIK